MIGLYDFMVKIGEVAVSSQANFDQERLSLIPMDRPKQYGGLFLHPNMEVSIVMGVPQDGL